MRRLTLAALTTLALAAPAVAQDISFPVFTPPEPGTFCGPLQLCEPLVTRDVRG